MVKGDIVLITFPFTDMSGSKLRPAIVLAASSMDLTVCFGSSEKSMLIQTEKTFSFFSAWFFINEKIVRIRKQDRPVREKHEGRSFTFSERCMLTFERLWQANDCRKQGRHHHKGKFPEFPPVWRDSYIRGDLAMINASHWSDPANPTSDDMITRCTQCGIERREAVQRFQFSGCSMYVSEFDYNRCFIQAYGTLCRFLNPFPDFWKAIFGFWKIPGQHCTNRIR